MHHLPHSEVGSYTSNAQAQPLLTSTPCTCCPSGTLSPSLARLVFVLRLGIRENLCRHKWQPAVTQWFAFKIQLSESGRGKIQGCTDFYPADFHVEPIKVFFSVYSATLLHTRARAFQSGIWSSAAIHCGQISCQQLTRNTFGIGYEMRQTCRKIRTLLYLMIP